ncbi:hypothetical protein JRI60_04605 [Archangium violaceum]|uniref:hypothetical protein n=1 Tax=Archangium violaceum TaxID=83451 RepID=UPI00194FF8E4|nr:hypothetical protein [Archangium violaceum]QRN98348.1 hypothetical protein JRI60_04605 [Archangium violaceum]
MNYFIVTQTDGVIQITSFAQRLTSRWPQTHLEEISNPASSHALEFRIPMTHSRVDGSINRAGSALVFIGDLRDCAELALWCRSTLPAHEPLTLCDEGMSGSIELEQETTLAEIYAAFRYQPPRS